MLLLLLLSCATTPDLPGDEVAACESGAVQFDAQDGWPLVAECNDGVCWSAGWVIDSETLTVKCGDGVVTVRWLL